MTLELNAPASPLSEVTTRSREFFTSLLCKSGGRTEVLRIRFSSISSEATAKGLARRVNSWAFLILVADTTSIALVICAVLLVDFILCFIDLIEGIESHPEGVSPKDLVYLFSEIDKFGVSVFY